MRRLVGHGHDNRYAVSDEWSHALLMEIKKLLDVFAPIGDDLLHGLWMEAQERHRKVFAIAPLKVIHAVQTGTTAALDLQKQVCSLSHNYSSVLFDFLPL